MSADDPSTCDDLPPWAREAHTAPVLGCGDASARARADASLRTWTGSTDASVRFIVPGAHAAVASGDDGVTWWAVAARDSGDMDAMRHPTLQDASEWAWQQVKP